MSKSVLEAIQSGEWNYEPLHRDQSEFDCTQALPGSEEKLAVLADRIASGLPLWHPDDPHGYDEIMSEEGLAQLLLD